MLAAGTGGQKLITERMQGLLYRELCPSGLQPTAFASQCFLLISVPWWCLSATLCSLTQKPHKKRHSVVCGTLAGTPQPLPPMGFPSQFLLNVCSPSPSLMMLPFVCFLDQAMLIFSARGVSTGFDDVFLSNCYFSLSATSYWFLYICLLYTYKLIQNYCR